MRPVTRYPAAFGQAGPSRPLTPNLRLPRIGRVSASAEYRAAPPPKTILIVDDDRSVTETFTRML